MRLVFYLFLYQYLCVVENQEDEKFWVKCVQYGGSFVNQLRLPTSLVTAGRLRYENIPGFLQQVTNPLSKRKVHLFNLNKNLIFRLF